MVPLVTPSAIPALALLILAPLTPALLVLALLISAPYLHQKESQGKELSNITDVLDLTILLAPIRSHKSMVIIRQRDI